jgi:hypothetical protein
MEEWDLAHVILKGAEVEDTTSSTHSINRWVIPQDQHLEMHQTSREVLGCPSFKVKEDL